MSAKYDSALCMRLIAEAREDDARMTDAPWDCVPLVVRHFADVRPTGADAFGVARQRNNLSALADQLEAARAEIDRMRPVVEAAERYRDDGPAYAGIHPAVDAYRAGRKGVAMRPVVEAAVAWRKTPPLDRPIAEGGSTAPWVRAYRQLEIEIDAYIAASNAVGCVHRRTERGKDIPRSYGSYRSEVCLDCKAFRARDHHDQLITDSRGGWRPAEQYDQETAESDEE